MKWWTRILFFTFGLFTIFYGLVQMSRGAFSYQNSIRQAVFAPGVVAIGLVLAALSFLPAGEWIYRRITTRKGLDLPRQNARLKHKHRD